MAYWDKTQTEPVLPGLYQVIEKAKESVIRPGERGTIAMVTPGLAASKGKVNTLDSVGDALEALGVSNYKFAKRCFEGGARRILAYVPNDAELLEDSLEVLDAYMFDVFTMGRDVTAEEATTIKLWRDANELEGLDYVGIIGAPAGLADKAAILNHFATAKQGDIAHVGFAGVDLDGNVVSGGELAAWIAGKQGGRGMAEGSLTRTEIPFLSDVGHRFNRSGRTELYNAGVLVPLHTGTKVVIEGAITSSKFRSDGTTPHHAGGKLRIAYNAAVYKTTLNQAIEESFIGKINNDPSGQDILLGAVAGFNQSLIDEGVLSFGTKTTLHPDYQSVGDKIYLHTTGDFIDAAERFFFDFAMGTVTGGSN